MYTGVYTFIYTPINELVFCKYEFNIYICLKLTLVSTKYNFISCAIYLLLIILDLMIENYITCKYTNMQKYAKNGLSSIETNFWSFIKVYMTNLISKKSTVTTQAMFMHFTNTQFCIQMHTADVCTIEWITAVMPLEVTLIYVTITIPHSHSYMYY